MKEPSIIATVEKSAINLFTKDAKFTAILINDFVQI